MTHHQPSRLVHLALPPLSYCLIWIEAATYIYIYRHRIVPLQESQTTTVTQLSNNHNTFNPRLHAVNFRNGTSKTAKAADNRLISSWLHRVLCASDVISWSLLSNGSGGLKLVTSSEVKKSSSNSPLPLYCSSLPLPLSASSSAPSSSNDTHRPTHNHAVRYAVLTETSDEDCINIWNEVQEKKTKNYKHTTSSIHHIA